MERSTQQISELIKSDSSVYSATFIFRIKNYDSEFEHFNELIDDVANSNPGFLGKDGGQIKKKTKQQLFITGIAEKH